jgi:hypothetical protein
LVDFSAVDVEVDFIFFSGVEDGVVCFVGVWDEVVGVEVGDEVVEL